MLMILCLVHQLTLLLKSFRKKWRRKLKWAWWGSWIISLVYKWNNEKMRFSSLKRSMPRIFSRNLIWTQRSMHLHQWAPWQDWAQILLVLRLILHCIGALLAASCTSLLANLIWPSVLEFVLVFRQHLNNPI